MLEPAGLPAAGAQGSICACALRRHAALLEHLQGQDVVVYGFVDAAELLQADAHIEMESGGRVLGS